MSRKVLLVEDEVDIAELVRANLERAGFKVDVAYDGIEGLEKVFKLQPKLVILDLMLPRLDGYGVLKEMQRDARTNHVPILLLTARSQIDDRIQGLEAGADDYLSKPFSPKELVLRVQKILKRNRPNPGNVLFSYGPFHFDKNTLTFYLEEEPVNLTSTEFKLLLYLSQRPGEVQCRNDLLRIVWGYSNDALSRTLDTHMKRLRQKLGERSQLIETVRGVGYLVAELES